MSKLSEALYRKFDADHVAYWVLKETQTIVAFWKHTTSDPRLSDEEQALLREAEYVSVTHLDPYFSAEEGTVTVTTSEGPISFPFEPGSALPAVKLLLDVIRYLSVSVAND